MTPAIRLLPEPSSFATDFETCETAIDDANDGNDDKIDDDDDATDAHDDASSFAFALDAPHGQLSHARLRRRHLPPGPSVLMNTAVFPKTRSPI